MITNVILDVDGTLIDSVDFHAQSWQRALEKFGKTVELKSVRDQIGKGGDELMREFLSEAEIKDFGDELQDERLEIFKKDFLSRIQPFPEARTLVARLAADGKRIALASSANREELNHFKELLGIEDFLDAETNADDAEKSKPHPDIFQAALAELGGGTPENTVVVGDSPWDAIAARKIDLPVIGLLCGGFTEDWLKKEGCVEIYQNPADLLKNYDDSLLCCKDAIKIPTIADVVGAVLL